LGVCHRWCKTYTDGGYGIERMPNTMSDRMLALIAVAGVSTNAVRRLGERTVVLNVIDIQDGEHSFSYWRSQSAARLLAHDAGWLDRSIGAASHL